MVLLAHLRDQHRLSLGRHGRPRMTEELNELGIHVGQRRVGQLMAAFPAVKTSTSKEQNKIFHHKGPLAE